MTPLRYHPGQLEVQAEANSRDLADRMAQWVGPAGEFAERADLLLFAFADADRRLRFAAISGAAPLARVTGEATIRLAAARAPQFTGGRAGGLAINLGEARRVRLNGEVRLDDGGAALDLDEVFTLCRKYIVRSIGLGTEPRLGPTASEDVPFDSPWVATLVGGATTSFMASVAPDGAPDIAHRGGPAGFLAFDPAARTLGWPEYLGDGVFKSAGNVRSTGQIALLVPDFETGDAAVISGVATYVNERRLREERRDPLVQHRDAFPVQGRMSCEVVRVQRLSGLLHPRALDAAAGAVNSQSAVHEQAPQ